MRYVDYHTHSRASFDGRDTVLDLLYAAEAAGIDEICVTEHCECNGIYARGSLYPGHYYSRDAAFAQITRARAEYAGPVVLRFGVELGQACQNTDNANTVMGYGDYDYILGSLHNMRGYEDFYVMKYASYDECRELVHKNFTELREAVSMKGVNAIAHITYPLRYMFRAGFVIDIKEYQDEFRALYRLMVENGVGLEVNTKGALRDDPPTVQPEIDELKLFRECGGEIVTVGSDAHTADKVGAGVRAAYEAMRAAGFKYVCGWERRVPAFYPL